MADSPARRRRWWPLASFAALVALVALLVPVFGPTPPTGIRAHFDRIRNGTTEQEVEELLGGPRGVYGRVRRSAVTAAGTGKGRGHFSWWYFPGCTVEVGFDEDGRVNGKRIELAPPESLLDRAVRWYEQAAPGP